MVKIDMRKAAAAPSPPNARIKDEEQLYLVRKSDGSKNGSAKGFRHHRRMDY